MLEFRNGVYEAETQAEIDLLLKVGLRHDPEPEKPPTAAPPVPVLPAEPAPEPRTEPAQPAGPSPRPEMTKIQLLAIAAERGLGLDDGLTKKQILAALEATATTGGE